MSIIEIIFIRYFVLSTPKFKVSLLYLKKKKTIQFNDFYLRKEIVKEEWKLNNTGYKNQFMFVKRKGFI